MRVLNIDLDNTLIYSYKHNIGEDKINVELYNEREISFITKKTFDLLKQVKEKYLIVPTTTRTKEQYDRIFLGIGGFKYSLVCNGGILLINGKKDNEWYNKSKKMIAESNDELLKAVNYLENESLRIFEVRFIEELFIFTKCDEPEKVVESLKEKLDLSLVDVFNNGVKVYVVPKKLDKGTAVKRFRKFIEKQERVREVLAAGDSEFDVSMVKAADIGIVPTGFMERFQILDSDSLVYEMPEEKLFSEELLEKCINIDIE